MSRMVGHLGGLSKPFEHSFAEELEGFLSAQVSIPDMEYDINRDSFCPKGLNSLLEISRPPSARKKVRKDNWIVSRGIPTRTFYPLEAAACKIECLHDIDMICLFPSSFSIDNLFQRKELGALLKLQTLQGRTTFGVMNMLYKSLQDCNHLPHQGTKR